MLPSQAERAGFISLLLLPGSLAQLSTQPIQPPPPRNELYDKKKERESGGEVNAYTPAFPYRWMRTLNLSVCKLTVHFLLSLASDGGVAVSPTSSTCGCFKRRPGSLDWPRPLERGVFWGRFFLHSLMKFLFNEGNDGEMGRQLLVSASGLPCKLKRN